MAAALAYWTGADRRDSDVVIVKSEPGAPTTFGNAAPSRVRLIVWCGGCIAANSRRWLVIGAPRVSSGVMVGASTRQWAAIGNSGLYRKVG